MTFMVFMSLLEHVERIRVSANEFRIDFGFYNESFTTNSVATSLLLGMWISEYALSSIDWYIKKTTARI